MRQSKASGGLRRGANRRRWDLLIATSNVLTAFERWADRRDICDRADDLGGLAVPRRDVEMVRQQLRELVADLRRYDAADGKHGDTEDTEHA